MADAARTTGVDISVPIDPAALSAKFYRPDGMASQSRGRSALHISASKGSSREGRDSRDTSLPRRSINTRGPLTATAQIAGREH